jgi:hypothetical protein
MKPSCAPGFGAVIVLLALASAPARAGDDGQASLITGLVDSVGLGKHDDKQIDFRERSRLVLPPKKELPPPGKAADRANWPVNVETMRDKRRKQIEDAEPSARAMASRDYVLIKPGDDVKVTTSGFEGSSAPSCRVPDPKTGECPKAPKPEMNWNPLTWVGLEKKPATVLGEEPAREDLTDPPKGYRAPAEGVGAKVNN